MEVMLVQMTLTGEMQSTGFDSCDTSRPGGKGSLVEERAEMGCRGKKRGDVEKVEEVGFGLHWSQKLRSWEIKKLL